MLETKNRLLIDAELGMFRRNFDPQNYLQYYYSDMDSEFISQYSLRQQTPLFLSNTGQENSSLLMFFAQTVLPAINTIKADNPTLLEVGGGPTIYQFISIASMVAAIYFTDYLSCNIECVRNWVRSGEPSFFWRKFIHGSLLAEGNPQPITNQEIAQREQEVKQKLKYWGRYDVINDCMLEADFHVRKFDIVSSSFCLESITSHKLVWQQAFRHLAGKLKIGGLFVMTALKEAAQYRILEDQFAAVSINENDLLLMLKSLDFFDISIGSHRCLDLNNEYKGFMFVTATKGNH